LTIKVTLVENKDKKEFEKWLEQVDDDLFSDVLEELQKEGLANLNELYNSEKYGEVIKKVRAKTKEVAARRIKELQKLI
jgi:Mg/Co/Ni transporter MgtE